MAGLSLAMRDVVHEKFGAFVAFACVIVGAALSAAISPALAFASASAFILCELVDTAVYAGMRRRLSRSWAVALSGVAGAVVDGLSFVWIAFGSMELGAGNVIGKIYASVALALFWWWRSRN